MILHSMVFVFTQFIYSLAEQSNESYISFITKNGTFHINKNDGWYMNHLLNDTTVGNGKTEYTANITNGYDKNKQMSQLESIAAELMQLSEIDIIPKANDKLLPVHIAIINGHNNVLVSLLKDHHAINERTYNNLTLLHLATIYNNYEAVSILLEHNVDVLARTTDDLTSLHIACIYDNIEATKLLINNTALVNMKAVNNLTALHFAAASNSINISTILVENRAVIDITDKNQQTPFYIALKYNNKELAYALSQKGANVNLLLANGTTFLHLAVQKDDKNAIKLLLTYPNLIDKADSFGSSALHFAALYGRLNACSILLTNGANVFARDMHNNMAIHLAASRGETGIVLLLLKQNSSLINARGGWNATSVHRAVMFNQSETTNFLLSKGANVNDTANHIDDPEGTEPSVTILHLAAQFGMTNILKIILKYKPDIFAKDKKGDMPIHSAAAGGSTEAVAILLECSPSLLEARNNLNRTPTHMAVLFNQSETTNLLLSKGANVNATANYANDTKGTKPSVTILHWAAQAGMTNILKIILKYKPDIFAKDNDGDMPIHLAALNGLTDAVAILIEHSSDLIDARGQWNYSLLHYAVAHDHAETTSFLLDKGANVNDTANYVGDPEGMEPSVTILHLAAQFGMTNILKIILKYKPNVFAKDNDGNMPIHLAALNGSTDAVAILSEHSPSLLEARNNLNRTPTYMAVLNNQSETTNLLLSKGADVNATANYADDPKGTKPLITILHCAARLRLINILKIILKHKPDVFAKDKNGNLPIHLAALHGSSEAVAILLEHSPSLLEARNNLNMTPTHAAVLFNQSETTNFLLSKGANVNATANSAADPKGTNPSVTILHLAAQLRLINILKIILKYKPDIFAKNNDGNMPIHLAALNGLTEVLSILLEHSPSLLEARNNLNRTPTHMAVIFNQSETTNFLLSKGANVNDTANSEDDPKGTEPSVTILCYAAHFGLTNILKLILKYKPDVFTKDKNGNLPIHLAAMEGSTDAVAILLEHSPSLLEARNNLNKTPTHVAVLFNQSETTNLLLSKGANVNATANYADDPKGTKPLVTILHWAAQLRFINILKIILKFKPDVFAKDINGNLPIHLAALEGSTDAVAILLEHSPSLLEARNNLNKTPTHVAVLFNQSETTNLLLSKGADVNATANYANDPKGTKASVTILHWAARLRHINILKIILKFKPDVFAKEINGNMPIHFAAWSGSTEAVGILLEHSSSLIDARGQCNFSLLHFAVASNHSEATRLLLEKGANVNSVALLYCNELVSSQRTLDMTTDGGSKQETGNSNDRLTNLDMFLSSQKFDVERSFLFRKDTNVNNFSKSTNEVKRMKSSVTILHLAAQKGLTNILTIILKYKPDIFAKDNVGDMPIHYAATSRKSSAVYILIKKDPNLVNAIGNMHYTPLHYSVHSPAYSNDDSNIELSVTNVNVAQQCNKDVLCTLLQLGADVFAKDRYGYTPTDLAKIFNETDCLSILNGYNISFFNDSGMSTAVQTKQICFVNNSLNDIDATEVEKEESKNF